jgi:hypothetical protein
MVIFCSASGAPFHFRKPSDPDFLGSHARRENLWPKYEVDDSLMGRQGEVDVLIAGEEGKLDIFQQDSAIGHWGIMRQVMPEKVWELF